MGDKHGEVDTRFLYAALNCASLIQQLPALNIDAAVDYVMRCQNFDGAFGLAPGCESHTGQVFCCVGVLSIAGHLGRLDTEKLGRWCAAVVHGWRGVARLRLLERRQCRRACFKHIALQHGGGADGNRARRRLRGCCFGLTFAQYLS
jgi:hypothetical protein